MLHLELRENVEPKLKNFFPKSYKKAYFYTDIEDESSSVQSEAQEKDEDQLRRNAKPAERAKATQYQAWAPSHVVPSKFQEKHLIESLSVNAVESHKPVMFFSMLNQGNKRGK